MIVVKTVLFKNARIVDHKKDEISDILVEDGLIKQIAGEFKSVDQLIDLKGGILMPAFTDLHVHFRDPGYTYKEDIFSGSKAAVAGGYTTVNLMANTNPVCSDNNTVEYVIRKAEKCGLVDAFQTSSITRDFDGKDISHLKNISNAHVKIISDDGFGVESYDVMEEALMIAKDRGFVVSSHAEYTAVSGDDPRESENLMTKRDIELCEKTNARLHMAHVSTKEAIKMIQHAKKRGVPVTCEVTPHHISINDDIKYEVHPPLRKRCDVIALTEAIVDGTVDCIATDHAPHSKEDKEKGARGISSIEIAFSICYSYLVRTNKISLMKLSELMSFNPSKILQINKGEIAPGRIADFILIDPDIAFTVDENKFISKGKNTPINGMKLYGRVLSVYKNGERIYDYKGENDG
jgi:dihydroorotase